MNQWLLFSTRAAPTRTASLSAARRPPVYGDGVVWRRFPLSLDVYCCHLMFILLLSFDVYIAVVIWCLYYCWHSMFILLLTFDVYITVVIRCLYYCCHSIFVLLLSFNVYMLSFAVYDSWYHLMFVMITGIICCRSFRPCGGVPTAHIIFIVVVVVVIVVVITMMIIIMR